MATGRLLSLVQRRREHLDFAPASRRILLGASVVGALSLAVALATAARDLVIAASFGTSDVVDAYLIAFMVPNFIIYVLSGSFAAAFIPVYLHVKAQKGDKASTLIFSQILFLGTLLLIVVAVIAIVLGNLLLPVVASNFDPGTAQLTQHLYNVFLPIILISGLTTICSAALNAHEHFAMAAFAPILVPITSVAFILALGRTWGIYALAFGTIAGCALQFMAVGFSLRKRGLAVMPQMRHLDPDTRIMIGQYLPMVIGVCALGATQFVDQTMAASLGPGSVAALAYGGKVAAVAVVLGVTVAKSVIFPYFSRLVAEQAWNEVGKTVRNFACLIIIGTVPLTLMLFFFSTPLTEILFERGAFHAQDSQRVGEVQAMYVLQIPFQILGNLFAALLSSLGANQIVMRAWVTSMFLNIVLNYVLMMFIGLKGIALASSIVYAMLCIVLAVLSYRMIQLHRSAS